MIKSLNRYIYGPTPEERVQEWQRKLRGEQRVLDKEIRQVSASGRYEIFQSEARVLCRRLRVWRTVFPRIECWTAVFRKAHIGGEIRLNVSRTFAKTARDSDSRQVSCLGLRVMERGSRGNSLVLFCSGSARLTGVVSSEVSCFVSNNGKQRGLINQLSGAV